MNIFKQKNTIEETMSPCLVQQLFRQKIGQELDQSLVDEILFPMLRLRRHPSKELLQDIKLTQSFNENGQSAIVQIFYGGTIRNSSLFGPRSMTDLLDLWPLIAAKTLRYGKNTSKCRRQKLYHTSWGSVDILNELRESNTRYMIQFEKEGMGMSISLDEESHKPHLVPKPKLLNELLNEFIEQSLLPDKRLSWGGDPDKIFVPTLSTRY
tara:strand:- start:1623 stop:2252 length:630 start_codon:yes stop_codon:yes gene_type:complete